MSPELYLARRYLFDPQPGASRNSIISWIATGSVALGVAALITTLAVMSGFRNDIQNKILGVQPHLILTNPFESAPEPTIDAGAILSQEKEVLAWAPFVSGQVLMGHGGSSSGAYVKGIDPTIEPKVSQLEKKLIHGSWGDLSSSPERNGEKPGIFLGQELARNIGVRTGDQIWFITSGSMGLATFTLPEAHIFIVKGIIQSGLYDYDSTIAYIDLNWAKKLFVKNGGLSGIGVRLRDPDKAQALSKTIQEKLGGQYWVRSWLSLNQNLFSALKLEKTVMFIILILITLVASFMIVSNLLLIISQKVKEIGILRAMGATSGTIRKIFLLQGLLMGFVGNIIGIFLGLGLSSILAKTNLIKLPADVYYIDKLPVQINSIDVLIVFMTSSIIVLLATTYPAHKASQLDPLDAIRYG